MKKIENDLLKIKLENLQKKIESDGIFESRNLQKKDLKESFTFVVYCLQRIKNDYILNDEFYNSITDGFNDNDIDIFDINEEGDEKITINIAQVKYKTNDSSLNQTIGTNEIRLFKDSIKRIIINNNSTVKKNTYLDKQTTYFNEIVKSNGISNIRINLFLITNGSELSDFDYNELKNFRNEPDFKSITSFEFYNISG